MGYQRRVHGNHLNCSLDVQHNSSTINEHEKFMTDPEFELEKAIRLMYPIYSPTIPEQDSPVRITKTVTSAPTLSPSLSPSPPSTPTRPPVCTRLYDSDPKPDFIDYSPSSSRPFG